MTFSKIVGLAGLTLDGAGVLIIVVGALSATIIFLKNNCKQRSEADNVYRQYRQALGKVILLGLEFLVAGDIVRTVALKPTYSSVGLLALIVLIRTFLSFTMQLEIEHRWPWQKVNGAIVPEK